MTRALLTVVYAWTAEMIFINPHIKRMGDREINVPLWLDIAYLTCLWIVIYLIGLILWAIL
jgi:hypothetical protein